MIQEVLDRPIAYHACLARLAGSVTAGVFLSQAIYWSNRTRDPEGWFFKRQPEWEGETMLTRREQESAAMPLCPPPSRSWAARKPPSRCARRP